MLHSRLWSVVESWRFIGYISTGMRRLTQATLYGYHGYHLPVPHAQTSSWSLSKPSALPAQHCPFQLWRVGYLSTWKLEIANLGIKIQKGGQQVSTAWHIFVYFWYYLISIASDIPPGIVQTAEKKVAHRPCHHSAQQGRSPEAESLNHIVRGWLLPNHSAYLKPCLILEGSGVELSYNSDLWVLWSVKAMAAKECNSKWKSC